MEKYDTNGYIHTYIRSYTHTQRDKRDAQTGHNFIKIGGGKEGMNEEGNTFNGIQAI